MISQNGNEPRANAGRSARFDLPELRNRQQTRNERPSIAEIQMNRRREFEIIYNLRIDETIATVVEETPVVQTSQTPQQSGVTSEVQPIGEVPSFPFLSAADEEPMDLSGLIAHYWSHPHHTDFFDD